MIYSIDIPYPTDKFLIRMIRHIPKNVLRNILKEKNIGSEEIKEMINNPQWIELKTVILTALAPYPEAKTAVRKALSDGHGD